MYFFDSLNPYFNSMIFFCIFVNLHFGVAPKKISIITKLRKITSETCGTACTGKFSTSSSKMGVSPRKRASILTLHKSTYREISKIVGVTVSVYLP